MRLAVLLVVLAACSVPGEPIRDWTLSAEGEHTPVTLPGNFYMKLSMRDQSYALRTSLEIPAELRGRELSVIEPCFHGDVALAIDGVRVVDRGDFAAGEHRWPISVEQSARGTLVLELVAYHDNLSVIGFGVEPYLSTELATDRGLIAAMNRQGAMMELGLIAVFALLYCLLYAKGRRPEDGAFVVITICSLAAPLWQLGLLGVFGPFRVSIPTMAICGAQLGVLYFIHHSFALGPPPPRLVRAFGALVVACLLGPVSYKLVALLTLAMVAVNLFYLAHMARMLVVLIRPSTPRHVDARLLLVVMIVTAVAVIPDVFGLIVGRNYLGGVHTISLGIVGCVVTQALMLSRSHVARQRELERSEAELRRQVAERSRELSDALAELARRPVQPLGEDRVIAGRYKIVKRLGAGGMGTVYEVARTTDDRHLALKTLRGRAEPDAMARFAREAQIAAELDHPNLVPVLDVGIADGALYLVMPLIDGGSLEQQRAKFGDPAWARPILHQIAGGLAALHVRNIVHRDLKPGNVLLAPIARIADFGLSALEQRDLTLASGSLGTDDTAAAIGDTVRAGTPSPPLTRAGDIFGTPRYMAPELADGGGASAAPADVFAFGVIAFELLTGKQPFPEPIVMLRLDGRAIPEVSLAVVGDRHRAIVGRCLALDPAERPSATELVAAFAAA